MANENRVSLSHSGRTSIITRRAIRQVMKPYVRFEGFKENLIFSPLSAYSLTPKAN